MDRDLLYEPARHLPVAPDPWDAEAAEAVVREIVEDALARFDPERFWPAHPLDEGARAGDASLYLGATGVLLALERLGARPDPAPPLERLVAASRAQHAASPWYSEHGSFLMGEVGALLLALRFAPDRAVADALYARIEANLELPVLELMWGTPGTMLAARFARELTGEERWRALYVAQAERLLAELEETPFGPLWTQPLYGRRCRYLGAVHGFAGNVQALFCGWEWLAPPQRERIAEAVVRTTCATARESAVGVNWPAIAGEPRPRLVQYCHGAAGIVVALAAAPVRAPVLERPLARAGDLIWRAGPLAKGAGLCHGTAGNGYALLWLYRHFGEPLWLERARAFAMSAIAQWRAARRRYRRGRYTLWTGDLGLALYLRACASGDPRFPSVDVF